MAGGDRTVTRNKQFNYFNSIYFTKNPGTEGAIPYKIRRAATVAAALLRRQSACKWHHLICKPLATARCICIPSPSAAYCPLWDQTRWRAGLSRSSEHLKLVHRSHLRTICSAVHYLMTLLRICDYNLRHPLRSILWMRLYCPIELLLLLTFMNPCIVI